MLSEEYLQEKIIALQELCLWKYLSDEEKESLRQASNEIKADILMRTFIDKYYDIMIEEYENVPEDDYLNMPILDMGLKTKAINALMRKGLYTTGKFVEFIKENGWARIPGLGYNLCKELYVQIYDKTEEEIEQLIKATKIVKKKINVKGE